MKLAVGRDRSAIYQVLVNGAVSGIAKHRRQKAFLCREDTFMSEDQMRKSAGSSQTQDYFQLVLDGADMFSSIWQPMLKSVGRWQLEVAGLGMKQGQAALQLSRDLSRCLTPGDIASANMRTHR
jgi:hypothetical protein